MTIKKRVPNDKLGTRMKQYEQVSQHNLIIRTPTIIRIDGKAFHTFVKRLPHIDQSLQETPFSKIMHESMMFTTSMLVQHVQTCVMGYTQSDEISLLLRDYDRRDTESWFNNNIQKITSVSSSIATAAFNLYFPHGDMSSFNKMALFDSRVYSLPKEEVVNYFIWRQQDAMRNSVQMYGRHFYSHNQMNGITNVQVKDALFTEFGVNWDNLPTWMKQGSCVAREKGSSKKVTFDENIPIFTTDREFIEKFTRIPTEVCEERKIP